MCEHVVVTCRPTADNYFHWKSCFGHKVSLREPNWEQFGNPYLWTLVMRADRVETGPALTFGTPGRVEGEELACLQCWFLGAGSRAAHPGLDSWLKGYWERMGGSCTGGYFWKADIFVSGKNCHETVNNTVQLGHSMKRVPFFVWYWSMLLCNFLNTLSGL